MPNGELGYEDVLQEHWAFPYRAPWGPPQVGKAPHLGHSKHLCDMADKGADLETVKNLVRDAKFICRKCGRAAAKEENLCEPVSL